MKHAEKISAFGYDVYKFNIFNDCLTISDSLVTLAMAELEKPEVKLNQSCNLDKGFTNEESVVWSSFDTPGQSFFNFENSDQLLKWIKQKISIVAPVLGFHNSQSVDLTIDWMNVMYKGSFGNCHTHHDICEVNPGRNLVAIFYLSAPKNSSDLLILKNTKDYSARGISPATIPPDEIFSVAITTGDLIIHKVDLPHAVSEHLSNDPRLCLVMEFRV